MYNNTTICNIKNDNSDYPNSTSQSEKTEKEEKEMSVSCVRILKDGIIMLSDSRSTKKNDNKLVYDDNYDKICYVESLHLGIVSTGLNEFDGDALSDVVNDINNNSTNLNDFINKLNSQLQYYVKESGIALNITYAYYTKSINYRNLQERVSPIFTNFNITTNAIKEAFQEEKIDGNLATGVTWCCDFFKDVDLAKLNGDSISVAKSYKQIIEQMIICNQLCGLDSYIGGAVKALILHPDGSAEWL